jgi:heat shock protein HslJ
MTCKTGKGNTPNKSKGIMQLNGTWELNSLAGSTTGFDELYPGKKPKLVVDVNTKKVSGNTGCNSFSGPVTLDDTKLIFDQPMVLTKMFCPGDGETAFLEALKKVNTWSVTDGTKLSLLNADVGVLNLTKVQ